MKLGAETATAINMVPVEEIDMVLDTNSSALSVDAVPLLCAKSTA
ncbi:hypothetical protein [Sphingomonas sp. R647]|nr:hypothetical protein [Sphingomonas sp. R647]